MPRDFQASIQCISRRFGVMSGGLIATMKRFLVKTKGQLPHARHFQHESPPKLDRSCKLNSCKSKSSMFVFMRIKFLRIKEFHVFVHAKQTKLLA